MSAKQEQSDSIVVEIRGTLDFLDRWVARLSRGVWIVKK
jgi:hypothetical protein